MKKGICYDCIDGGGPLEQRVAAARRAGYDAVELTIRPSGDAPLTLEMDQAAVRAVGDIMARAGLETPSLMGAVLSDTPVLSPDPAVRRQAVERLSAALERAAWIGVSTVLLHPGQL